jgi:hypothetical protein
MSATSNEFFIDQYTSELQKLIREVVNDPSTYLGSEFLPSVASPVLKVRNEVVESTGGVTNDYLPGTSPKFVQSFGSRVQEFSPGYWKEAIHYDETKILFLRELGQKDPSRRGIEQYIDLDIDRLNRRLEAKIELLRWQAILNGGFTWNNLTTAFSIPSFNTATPLAGNWSLDGINANNSATPIQDLRYWLAGGYGPYRKYKVKRIIMNPNTARWFLDNSSVRSYVQNALANPAVAQYGINEVLKFFYPGCPPVVVYDGWFQQEQVGPGNGAVTSINTTPQAQQIVTTNGIYFIPDGAIFFDVTNLPGGDKLGSFVQTVHLASGTPAAPGFGKFLVVEENIAPGTKGGPGNPYIDIFAGVYGGPNLERAFDVLTASVGPTAGGSYTWNGVFP